MGDSMKRILGVLCCVLLLAGVPVKALEADPVLRVGLVYGNETLPAANLQNETGSGYRFGYYDGGRNFVYLAQTAETKITMLKGQNLYLADGTYSETPGGTPIGMYFVDIGQTFSDYASAKALADQYRAQGLMGYVHFTAGAYGVRIDSNTTEQNAQDVIVRYNLAGASVKKAGDTCVTVVVTGSDNILFQFDSSPNCLAVLPTLGEVARPLTWFKGYKYAGGFEYRRFGGNITVINVVSMQDYAKGVIPYEMSPSWPLEALKAQTLCAKTYAVANLNKHQAYSFDVCKGTDCQVYNGANNATDNSDRAVDETHGLYITYQGTPIQAFYHSSDGGSTESSGNVWNTEYPYLKAVSDPYEDTAKAGNGIWSYTVTNDTLTKLLTAKGQANSGVVNFYVDEFTPAGNVYRIVLVDSSGKRFVYEKEKVRLFLNNTSLGMTTNSVRFTINGAGTAAQVPTGTLTAELTLRGAGGEKTASGGLYAIGAGGSVQQPMSGIKILTASGLQEPASSDSGGSTAPITPPNTIPTPSNGTYFVQGRGWGHNVGMSQWGARAMAEQGYTYDQIIKFYFTGVDVSY